MKVKLTPVPNKLGRNDVTRAKLKKHGAIKFSALAKKELAMGATNAIRLDLRGQPVPVDADSVRAFAAQRPKAKPARMTQFEKAIRAALAKNEIELEEDAVVEIAVTWRRRGAGEPGAWKGYREGMS
jgi:hypothetical protein